MTGHCDADVLAEFREGLLGRRRSARIRAHLAGCSRCASLSSALAEVSALLASAPVPRVPDELAARLDGVLAAESAARAQAGTPAAAAGDARAAPGGHGAAHGAGRRRLGRPRPARAARPQRPWRATALRAASVTAAVLVIGGGGYGVSRLLQGGAHSSSSATASGAGGQRSGTRFVHGAQASGGAGQPDIPLHIGGLRVVHSGMNYLPGQLAAQAARVLARYALSYAGGKSPAGTARPPAGLPGCVKLVAGGTRVSLVDLATYQGQQATVIIEAGTGGQPGQVWVVRPGCSAGHRDLIAQVSLPVAATGHG
jgi:hypothetical protein